MLMFESKRIRNDSEAHFEGWGLFFCTVSFMFLSNTEAASDMSHIIIQPLFLVDYLGLNISQNVSYILPERRVTFLKETNIIGNLVEIFGFHITRSILHTKLSAKTSC